MSENFLKSDHPAVVRSKPAQPEANSTGGTAPRLEPREDQDEEEETAQVGSNVFSEYIVPIPDINADAEGACELEDTATQSTSRYWAVKTAQGCSLLSCSICPLPFFQYVIFQKQLGIA